MLTGSFIDHTLLKPDGTTKQIDQLCTEAIEHQFATVCIQPCHVKYVAEKYPAVRVCTVIGFPLGSTTTQTKLFECQQALNDGAQEIDMVINIGKVKDGNFDYIQNEIEQLAKLVHSSGENKLLKVIIETCLLNENEKEKLCQIVGDAGADFIKTSTGFSTGGATLDDIKLLRQYSPKNVQVKASGGIRDGNFARDLIQAGATRLGTSSGVALMKDIPTTSNY
jgi:deoxyribose-phosphate aldolase